MHRFYRHAVAILGLLPTIGLSMPQTFTRDQLALTVVRLEGGGKVGTGFFINAPNGLFLATAAHVASALGNSGNVTFCGDNQAPVTFPLSDVSGFASNEGWLISPVADVAIHRLKPTQTFADAHLRGRFLPLETFVADETYPSRDTPLEVIGFPLGLGVSNRFSPLSQQSKAASGAITLLRFDTKTPQDFFILEAPSVGGYSGAPCFDLSVYQLGAMTTSTGTGTRCHGLMHGTLSDETGGKLAAVTPSFYLVQLIATVSN
jgi:hypothetical protein